MNDIKLSSQRTEEAEEQIGEVENGVQTTWFTFKKCLMVQMQHTLTKEEGQREIFFFFLLEYTTCCKTRRET